MHANRTDPTCIQANIYAMACTMFPNEDIVVDLSSIKHIKNMRTVLALVSKYLACHHIGTAKEIKQLNTDETSRRRVSITNVVFGLLTEDKELRNICLTGSLIPPDGTAESQSQSIIGAFDEAKRHVKLWRDKTQRMYPNEPEYVPAGKCIQASTRIFRESASGR